MTIYKCDKCNKAYTNKTDYKRHMNRKRPCVIGENNGLRFNCPGCAKSYTTKGSLTRHLTQYPHHKNTHSKICSKSTPNDSNNIIRNSKMTPTDSNNNFRKSKTFECNFCKSKFTRKNNLNRHLKDRCKVKKQQNLEKEEIFRALLEKMNNMENEIKALRNENSKLTTINNINNTTNNVNNTLNINLVAFGKENKESLSNSELFKILRKGFKSVPELVKLLHFDENKPENHNIYISNMRDNYVMVFDGDRWALRDRAETLENIFDDGRNFLVVQYNDMKASLNDKQRSVLRKFERFDHDIDHHDDKKNEIYNDIKLILYNGRELPLKVRKSELN